MLSPDVLNLYRDKYCTKYTTVFDVRTINGYNAGPAERLLKSVARQICNVKTKFI